MSASWTPREEHRLEAVRRLLSGLAAGRDVVELSRAIADLHPRHNTFPAEVFLKLAADTLRLAGIGADNAIAADSLRDRYLPECRFRGRENRKLRFVLLATGARRGGIEPDLLDETVSWQTDDLWWYALAAAVAVIRACADRLGEPVGAFVGRLGRLTGIAVD